MEKIKDFFNKIFNRKKYRLEHQSKVLFKPKKTFFKKRNYFSIKINTSWMKIFKRNYIPYYLIFWIIFIIFLMFIILWPIFRVEKLNITRKDGISNVNISYMALDDFRWESIFSIDKKDVLSRLKNYQENIKDIDLEINYPKTLNIVLESYKPKFNVTINKKNYLLLENGALTPTINPSSELKTLDIIKSIDSTRILDYKLIFDMNYIAKIEEIEKKVKENIAQIDITWLKYYEKERELHVILNNFSRLIFSLDDDISIDEQIKSLAVLDREKSQVAKNDKLYIDLRIKWKVFYCSIEWDKNKQKERQCTVNLQYIYSEL